MSILLLFQTEARDRTIRGFEDVLEVTSDFHAALAAVGRDYESMKRTLTRAKRDDLVERLKAWRIRDNESVRFALGRQWQEGRA